MKNRMSKSILFILLVFSILCIHCGGDKNPVAPANEFDGIWRSEGYGYIFEIDGSQFTWYEETSESLIEFTEAALNGDKVTVTASTFIGDFTITLTFSLSGDKLTVDFSYPYPPKSITFNRIASLPALTRDTRDPEITFEILWQTFEENYAFFELRNVDWNAQYQTFRPQVNPNTTDAELFDIMAAMLMPFDEDHVTLTNGMGRWVNPGPDHPLEDRVQEIFQIIVGKYLNGNFSLEANDKFLYGKLTDKIGYLNILAMQEFSPSFNDFSAQQSALESGLDKIIQEFKDLDALVIDVRFNDGGYADFSRMITSRFADQKRLVYSKQARYGGYNDFLPLLNFYVEPAGALQFTKKIVLLTSGFTASAAEEFTLSLMPYPYVTRIGEPTNGIFSDQLLRKLPNGWGFFLSNERYFSHEGVNYEKIGIPPDIEIFMSEADLAAGKDSILDAALQLLQGN
ncbi:MAG: S41 family peptidase [bacterium]